MSVCVVMFTLLVASFSFASIVKMVKLDGETQSARAPLSHHPMNGYKCTHTQSTLAETTTQIR